MSNKSFMGRVFLAPSPSKRLYVNIGWVTAGNQQYPEWSPHMEEAISKECYDVIMSKIKTYLDGHSVNLYAAAGCYVLLPFIGWGMLKSYTSHVTRVIKEICAPFDGVRVELIQSSFPVTSSTHISYDQFGKRLERSFRDNSYDQYGKRTGTCIQPCWPPQGYNVILDLPETSNVREVWTVPRVINTSVEFAAVDVEAHVVQRPEELAHGANASEPVIAPAYAEPAAVEVQADNVQQPEGPTTGQDHAASGLLQLKEPFDHGAITQDEYHKIEEGFVRGS